MDRPVLLVLLLVLGAAGAALFVGHEHLLQSGPLRVGVLLPLEGPDAVEFATTLDWAAAAINRAGGVNGRPIALVYSDTSGGRLEAAAGELLADPGVRVVIGPFTTGEAIAIGPRFGAEERLLVSPTATGDELFRAFAGQGYVWRTCPDDVAQARATVDWLAEEGIGEAALVYENTSYGATFHDWTPFFGREQGVRLTEDRAFERGAAPIPGSGWTTAAALPADAARLAAALPSDGRLLLTDAGFGSTTAAASETGTIRALAPAADPTSGFAVAFATEFGRPPDPHAPQAYDALLFGGAVLTRQAGAPGEPLGDSARFVARGEGTPVSWDPVHAAAAYGALARGEAVALKGATGLLSFDREAGVDPVGAYYGRYVLEAGAFRQRGTVRVDGTGTTSLARSVSGVPPVVANGTASARLPARTGLVAVIAATSSGWENYRHQADALAAYHLLRSNGLPDDRIVLMLADDLPGLAQNPLKGDVHRVIGGPNLRDGADVDLAGEAVTPDHLLAAVRGGAGAESGPGDDLLVFLVDHGTAGEILFPHGRTLDGDALAGALDYRRQAGGFRRALLVVDVCDGASLARNLSIPNVLFMTGAEEHEPSHAAVYDPAIRQWIADEFSRRWLAEVRTTPDRSLLDLYLACYRSVIGSHPAVLNEEHFGSLNTVSIRDFTTP